MNDKKSYKLIFKQLQPIHIGIGRYGVISETRIFIPGWTMWGALTKKYNQLLKNVDLSKNQELFNEITCFYPAFKSNSFEPLLPQWKNGEFYLGSYSEAAFRARFVDTFVSTAVVPLSRMAKDESLHEINIILPSIKKEFSEEINKELFWVGIVKISEDVIKEVKKKLTENPPLELIIGGDSRYGFGKVILEKVEKIEESTQEYKNLKWSNFLPFSFTLDKIIVESIIENIIEIERDNNNFGVKSRGLYYLPGFNRNEFIDANIETILNKGCLEIM